MNNPRPILRLLLTAACGLACVACDSGGSAVPEGKYVVLDTRTDQFDYARAKSLAQDAMSRYPDLGCMVGLFAYNPPMCLEAVKEAGKAGKIQICAFDESDPTLQGIVDGEVHGTVVQDPYRYGYESVRILAGLARGEENVLPEDGFLNIPARKITSKNVKEFWDRLKELKAPLKEVVADESVEEKPTVAFVTNGIDPFWDIAKKGALDGGIDFNVNVEVRMPPAGVEDQKRMVQDLLTQAIDGVAISPIDPDNQGDLLDEIAERTNLITHDSDAPNSKRLCYIGMKNYVAGRMCGQLVKEAMPEGGSVMIFVGRLEQLNARQRQQGVIDELLDRQPPSDGAEDVNTESTPE